jgi:hypothetical protein
MPMVFGIQVLQVNHRYLDALVPMKDSADVRVRGMSVIAAYLMKRHVGFNMHDYINGHTCPKCGRTNIICTIEDSYCENEGICDACLREYYDTLASREYDGEFDRD